MDALHFGSAYKINVKVNPPGSLAQDDEAYRVTCYVKDEFKNQTHTNAARVISDDTFIFAVPDSMDAALEQYIGDTYEGKLGERQQRRDDERVSLQITKNSQYPLESGMDCAAAVEQVFS